MDEIPLHAAAVEPGERSDFEVFVAEGPLPAPETVEDHDGEAPLHEVLHRQAVVGVLLAAVTGREQDRRVRRTESGGQMEVEVEGLTGKTFQSDPFDGVVVQPGDAETAHRRLRPLGKSAETVE